MYHLTIGGVPRPDLEFKGYAVSPDGKVRVQDLGHAQRVFNTEREAYIDLVNSLLVKLAGREKEKL